MLLLSCSLLGQVEPDLYKASSDVSVDDDFEKIFSPFFKKHKLTFKDYSYLSKGTLSDIINHLVKGSKEKEFKKMDFAKSIYCNLFNLAFFQYHFKSDKSAQIVESKLLSLNGDLIYDIVPFHFIFIRYKSSIFLVRYDPYLVNTDKNAEKIMEDLNEYLSKFEK